MLTIVDVLQDCEAGHRSTHLDCGSGCCAMLLEPCSERLSLGQGFYRMRHVCMNAVPTTVKFTSGLHVFIIHPLQLFNSLRPNRRPNRDDDKDTVTRICFVCLDLDYPPHTNKC